MNYGNSDCKDISVRETEVLKTFKKKRLCVSFSIKVTHNSSLNVFALLRLLYGVCILMAAPTRALPLCFGSSGSLLAAPSLCYLLSALLSILHP